MKIGLKYFVEKNIQMVDIYTGEASGAPFDQHTIEARIDGQVFRDSFVVTSGMKINNYREEALLFGIKLSEMGKHIQRQAAKGQASATTQSDGSVSLTF